MPQPDATDSPDKQLAARDELLQVMYWLRGEGLAKDVAAKDLTRWISLDASMPCRFIRSLSILPNQN